MPEMKRVARLAILGMVLQGSAHAAEPGAAAEPLLNKGSVVHSAPQVTKKNKSLLTKKAKHSGKVGAAKVDPKVKKQGSMTESPAESTDQSVQLRGVRG
jgi:hypothetical protein